MSKIKLIALVAGAALASPAQAQTGAMLFHSGTTTIVKTGSGPSAAITIHRGDQKCPPRKHWQVIIMEDGSGSFHCV